MALFENKVHGQYQTDGCCHVVPVQLLALKQYIGNDAENQQRDYLLNDQITISLGGDWLGGRRGTFKTYKKNTQIWVKGKYFF